MKKQDDSNYKKVKQSKLNGIIVQEYTHRVKPWGKAKKWITSNSGE